MSKWVGCDPLLCAGATRVARLLESNLIKATRYRLEAMAMMVLLCLVGGLTVSSAREQAPVLCKWMGIPPRPRSIGALVIRLLLIAKM